MNIAIGNELTPWEQRDRLGVFRGLLATLKGAAFSPRTFFATLRAETPWIESLWYGWLLQAVLGVLGTALYLVPILALHGGALPYPAQLGSYLAWPLAPVMFYPVIVLVAGGLVHLLALVTHGARQGIGGTLRAVCYSGAAVVFLIPLGPLGLWGLAIGVYALAGFQGMTVPRAALTLVGAGLLLTAATVLPLGVYLGRHLP
jgi:hypothetical protein